MYSQPTFFLYVILHHFEYGHNSWYFSTILNMFSSFFYFHFLTSTWELNCLQMPCPSLSIIYWQQQNTTIIVAFGRLDTGLQVCYALGTITYSSSIVNNLYFCIVFYTYINFLKLLTVLYLKPHCNCRPSLPTCLSIWIKSLNITVSNKNYKYLSLKV